MRYLRSNPGGGLAYGQPPNSTGRSEQFQHPVRENTLQAFSDISFGPSSGRSHQGILVSWAGAPLQWESSRQTLIALSTAEAELIDLITASQAGEAVAALIGEIQGQPPERRLLGDNAASIAIASGPPTSWRTRHLRLRAAALRERLEAGEWSVQHLSGEFFAADLFTKALPAQRFQMLLPLVGVWSSVSTRSLSRLQAPPSKWTRAAVALWALSVPEMLKGVRAEQGQDWVLLLSIALGIILLWEGVKFGSCQCLRCFSSARVGSEGPSMSVSAPVQVSVNVGSAEPHVGQPALRGPAPRSQGASVSSAVGPPPPIGSHSTSPSSRIPHNLTVHLTAHGERWHQNPECGDVRGRIAQQYLLCGNCTVGRLFVTPPDVPTPVQSTNPRPRRRGR